MYDVIVVGLGVYGAAITAEASHKGLKVLGIDAFAPPHARGSSHGGSRILRLTTIEAEEYVPLARQALRLWQEYDSSAEQNFVLQTGLAIIAQPTAGERIHHGVDRIVERACKIAKRHAIPYESLNGGELMARFPGLHIQPKDLVFYEPGAVVITPEAAVATLINRAKAWGATILTGKKASMVRIRKGNVALRLDGETVFAKRVILCTGPWQHKYCWGVIPSKQ